MSIIDFSRKPLPERPFVTLSYAQSLDGCIAKSADQRVRLSNDLSMKMTHRLRSLHDAILVGIGTIITDDPRLTVRLVDGESPQPVVMDSKLTIPLNSALIKSGAKMPWVFTSPSADVGKETELLKKGCKVYRAGLDHLGMLDIHWSLKELKKAGINSLMVEGGSHIITSFLSLGLVDRIVLTISPIMLDGVYPYHLMEHKSRIGRIELTDTEIEIMDDNTVISGKPVWQKD